MHGYWNKILSIDLTDQKSSVISPGDDTYSEFAGGHGLGIRLLFERIAPGIDPLGPDNILGFFPGLLTGSGFPMTGRWMAVCKSPLTGLWNDSNCGGKCGPEMKRAGFDGYLFTGCSENPVYVSVINGKVSFHDASSLWGLTTDKTHEVLAGEFPKGKSLYIGPAGEKKVLFSAIVDDFSRTAARGGGGAVMGSKNLKAVVFQGSRRLSPADNKTFKNIASEYRNFLKNKPSFIHKLPLKLMNPFVPIIRKMKMAVSTSTGRPGLILATFKMYGTVIGTHLLVQSGDAPVKNWGGMYIDYPPSKSEAISGDAVIAYDTKTKGCRNCYISCGSKASVPEGKWADLATTRPEYEALAGFGPLCLAEDLEFIFKVNSLCDRLGMDVISAAGVTAFAIECAENGLLDTGDLSLSWGNEEAIYRLVEMIGSREGVGDLLAGGVKRASGKLGPATELFAIEVHGQELPMHDPKYDPSYGVAYLTAAPPGRHNRASGPVTGEIREIKQHLKSIDFKKGKRYDYESVGRYQALTLPYMLFSDSLGFCSIAFVVGNTPPLVDLVNAYTGWDISLEDIFTTGERIMTLMHLFNLREGVNPGSFALPSRARGDPPQEKGPVGNITVDTGLLKKGFLETLDRDTATGIPSDKKLEDLRLKDLWERKTK